MWDDGGKELAVGGAKFTSDCCGREIEIKNSAQLEQIHSSGLERKLNEAALVRAKALLHDILHHAGWKRAHGTVFVVLTDDEWLPPLEGTESHEIIDSDRTPLMDAALRRDERRIIGLLETGANVNAQDQDGWTALMYIRLGLGR